MKKFLVLLAAFMLISMAVSAQEVSISLDGDASLQWGLNLDNMDNGFKNGTSASAEIVVAAETVRATEGEGWWGELEVKLSAVKIGSTTSYFNAEDEEVTFKNSDGDTVNMLTGEVKVEVTTAKITDGMIFVSILKPDANVDFAKGFDDEDAASHKEESKAATSTFDPIQGFTAGIENGEGVLSSASVLVYSNGAYDDDPADNDYGIGAKASLALVPEMVSADLGLFYDGFRGDTPSKFGFGVKPTLTMADLGLELAVGFDGEYDIDAEAFAWDVLANLSVAPVELASVSADLYANSDEVLDAKVGVDITATPVTAGVDVRLYDLLADDIFWGAGLKLGYAAGGITVSTEGAYDSNKKVTAAASVALGAELHDINNTTFTLGWKDFEKVGDADATKGFLYLETKIAF